MKGKFNFHLDGKSYFHTDGNSMDGLPPKFSYHHACSLYFNLEARTWQSKLAIIDLRFSLTYAPKGRQITSQAWSSHPPMNTCVHLPVES